MEAGRKTSKEIASTIVKKKKMYVFFILGSRFLRMTKIASLPFMSGNAYG